MSSNLTYREFCESVLKPGSDSPALTLEVGDFRGHYQQSSESFAC
jgi:hypothetical protein